MTALLTACLISKESSCIRRATAYFKESSMPTSVHTSTNGTAIHVTWDEPLHPNGPLMGYNVTWWLNNATQMSSDDPEASHKSSVFLEGAVGSYVIGELHSAASYTIEVRRINKNNSTVLEGVPVQVEASTTPNSYPPPQGANYTIRRVNASHFEINLTWQAPRTSASADIEQYEVFIQRIEEGKPPVVFTANPLRPGYLFEVANMNPFIEYIVQIRAYVRFGNAVVKGEAAEIRINVDAKLLLIVFNVQVNASADGVALVSWNSSLGADVQSSNTTMYVVNLVSTETGEEIEGTVVRSLQATFTGLKLTANYTARVTACDIRGHIRKCGDVSEARFQTPKEDVTPRPTDVSVVAVNSTALKVTWQMPTHSHGVDVTECRILWWPSMTDSASQSAEDVHTRIHFAKGNETTFIITGLEAYKSYDVEIVVFYVEDTVVKNVSVISKSTTAPKPFAPPSKVTFAISGDVDELTRVSISWQQPSKLAGPPLQGYYVDVCPIMTSSKSPTGALCKRYNTTSTTFVTVLEGLNKFEAYTVFVSAYRTHQGVAIVGNTEKTFVTIDPTAKLTVDGLQVEAITNDSLRISWTGVDLSASRWRALYRVKVILKSTGDQVFEKEVSTTEVVFTDFKKEEYSIQIEACIVRGGVQNCGKPNAASFSRSALVQDKHQVTIQTINSTAIAVTLNLQGATEPHLDGFKISWAPSKQHPNDTSHGKSSIVLLPSNATGFIIANLDSFKVYDIRVTKVYSDGISHWETVATRSETVTDPKPFPKPSGVTYKSSSSGGKSSIVLSWDAPTTSSETPTEGYIVSICPRDELQETTGGCQTYNTSASSLQVEVSGLRSFSEYAVEITAYATINGRVVKGESTRKVVVTSPPPIPVIENPLVYNSVEGTSVNISWARPDSLTGYEVAYEVVLIEEASGLVLSKQEVNISETTLEGLEPSTEYTVTITACLLRGTQRNCGNTTTLLFKTASKDVPKEPIYMHIKAVNSSALLVTWRQPSSNDTPVEGYVLTWWKESETFPEEVSTETKSLPADMTSFVISGLEANTTYHVNVSKLYQGSRTRQADTEVTSASTQPDPYLKPQGLRAEYISNSSEVTVTWDAFPVRIEDSPVRGYTVNLCVIVENETREDLQDCDQREVSAGIEKVVFTRVNSLSDYRAEVKAMVSQPDNGTEEGQPAFVRFHTPGPPVPDLRHTLRVDINATSATLFWRRPVGFDEYEVFYYVSVSSASSQLKVEKTTNLTEQIFEGLEPGTNYTADVATCLVRRKRWHCAGNTTIQFKTLPVGFQGEVRNFTAEAVSGTAVQLSWNAPGVRDALKDYRLSSWLYDTNHTRKAHSNVSTVPFYKTSAVIDRLEPYTTYAIEVTAEYEVGDVRWHGSPLLQIVTTKPDGLPFVKDVHIATTNRTTLSSDVVISWTTTFARTSAVEVEYHVILCVGSNASAHDCRNQSAKAPTSTVFFPEVKNFATLVAAVESLVKTENNIFEQPKVFSTGLSWAPEISVLNDLTVRDVTENSALVSWSKVQDFNKINGAYYNVVLIVRATQDATANGEFSGADSHVPQNGSVPNGQRIIVRNVTTSATSIELSNLKPWMNYTVAVTPTVVGEGHVFVGNSQSKDFTTLVGAPEKPRNVTVEESEDGHLLRWLPPNSWNGPPGGYEVSLTCTNGEVKGNSTSVSLEPDRMALRIPKLSLGVPCTVSISAYNLFEGEPLDGARVRVRFTPLARKGEATFEHPTIN